MHGVFQGSYRPGFHPELVSDLRNPVQAQFEPRDAGDILAQRIRSVVDHLRAGEVPYHVPIGSDPFEDVLRVERFMSLLNIRDRGLFGSDRRRPPVVQRPGPHPGHGIPVRVPTRDTVAVVVAHIGDDPVEVVHDLVQPPHVPGYPVHLHVGVQVVTLTPRQRGGTHALGKCLSRVSRDVEAHEAPGQGFRIEPGGLCPRFLTGKKRKEANRRKQHVSGAGLHLHSHRLPVRKPPETATCRGSGIRP